MLVTLHKAGTATRTGEEQFSMRNVLVLDFEGVVSAQLLELGRADFVFFQARSVPQAQRLLRTTRFCVVLVVFDACGRLRQEEVELLLAGPSTLEWLVLAEPQALACCEFQAFVLRVFHDYHTLPIDPQRLLISIGHACGKARLRLTLNQKKPEPGKFDICGDSLAMKALFAQLAKVIHSNAPVLIGGETGTGKELVARALHRYSNRANAPLVVVNCGAIPTHLIQSELFGHEKGAFTGAAQRQIGKIEAAKGGVLFLDEVGDLALDLQVSLLRVLQERVICRVGSTQTIPVDFRVIAASHVNLQEAVTQGRFREDLFYRLNVLHLEVPALRERADDITLLAQMVFQQYAPVCNNPALKGFSQESLRALSAHDWPGNVRELINRVQRAMVMSENRLLSPADLGLASLAQNAPCLTLDAARALFDRDVLESSLRANGHKVAPAARQLGVSRITFYRLMSKLNIMPKLSDDLPEFVSEMKHLEFKDSP